MSLPAPYSEVYLDGTGTRVEFPFGTNFTPISAGLVKCVIYLADGNQVVPTYTVDMSVGSITISALTLPDGTILSAPPADSIVRIYRDEPEAQNATASQLQAFTAKQLETSLDAIVAMIQEVSYTVDHKTVRLTEPQRNIVLQQLLEADNDSLIYWDNDARKLVTTSYKHQNVVQCAGGLFFRLRTNSVTHNPYLQWSTDGSDWHSMDFDSIDATATEAKQIAQDAKDVADEAKGIADDAVEIAEDAKDIAQDAKDIADTFDDRLTQAEQDVSDAKDIAQDASDAVSTHIADTNNPHSVTKTQVGLGNVDNTSDLNKPISTATQNALDLKMPISTKYGAALSLTINSTTYVVTAQLKDQDGNNLGAAQTIDLPLESVVVSGAYDSTTKEVVLTLQDGSTIRFSVADLVSGLQTEITALNMLSADLVDDTGTTHKFVTTTEKSTWNGKQDAISDLATIRAGASAGATAVQPGDNVSELVNDAGYLTQHQTLADLGITATASEINVLDGITASTAELNYTDGVTSNIQTQLNGKQATISDLATIRSGAALGTTAVQPGGLATVATTGNYADLNGKPSLATVATSGSYNDLSNKPTIPAAQVNSDWNANSGVAQILNKPTLGTAAAADTTDFATAAQGVLADTALQSGDNVSELTNDAGYLVMGDLTGFVTRTTAQTISGLKTFTADIVLSGTTSIKNTTSGVSYTMLYRDTSGIHVGTSTQALLLAGSGTRPTFNGNNVAMSADIPTVNNPTITITQGGVTKGSFTLNQASGDTIALDAGGGGSSTLTSLTDVSLTTPVSGDALVYDGNDWINKDIDYVVEKQDPDSGNNYTWYRKYKSGWVEQGGQITGLTTAANTWNTSQVTLPVTMADANYSAIANDCGLGGNYHHGTAITTKTTTNFMYYYYNASADVAVAWEVKGMAA